MVVFLLKIPLFINLFLTKISSSNYLKIFYLSLIMASILFYRDLSNVLDVALYMDEIVFLRENSILDSSLVWKGDFLFLIFLKILSYFDAQLAIFIYFFITIFLFLTQVNIFSKINKLPVNNLFLFYLSSIAFYLVFGNTLRQGLSFIFILGVFNHYKRNNFLVFTYLFLAALAHKAALIFVFPFLFQFLRKKLFISLLFYLPIIYFLNNSILKELIELKNLQYQGSANPDLFNDLIKLVIVSSVSFVSIFLSKEKHTLINMSMFIILLVSTILINRPVISSRLILYAQLLVPILLTYNFKSIYLNNRNNNKYKHSIILFSVVYLLLITGTPTFKSLMTY